MRGKYRLGGGVSPRFWLWGFVVLGGILVIYWKIQQGKLASEKSAIMARQRAVAKVLEPEVVPHMARLEEWVKQLAESKRSEFVDPAVPLRELQTSTGVYFRLRAANAKDVTLQRKAAERSLLDGFVACLFIRQGEPDPTRGERCRSSADCREPGLICNEYEVCVPPPRPYNMRLAYGALRVLTPEWTDELHQTVNDLEIRRYGRELEQVAKHDVPIAIQMMQKAKYFTVVLDDDPPGGLPEKVTPLETEEERVWRTAHQARVGVWDMKAGRQVLEVRARAAGVLRPVGEVTVSTPESQAAQAQQANSCSVALQVKAAVERIRAAASPSPEGSGHGG